MSVFQHGPAELWKSKERPSVNVCVVVFCVGDRTEGSLDVSAFGLGANHDTNLARGVYEIVSSQKTDIGMSSQVGMVVKAYSETANVFLQVSLRLLIRGKWFQRHSA